MYTTVKHSWQVKGFKQALPAAGFAPVATLEQYLGNRNIRPDTTGSVFRGDEVDF